MLATIVPSAVALAIPAGSHIFDRTASLYGAGRWALLAVLAAAGLVLAVGRPAAAGVSATAGLFAAGQLCATGIWAIKHWEPFSGMVGTGWDMLPLLRSLAVVLAVAGAAATAACLLAMRRSGAWAGQTTDVQRKSAFAVGAAVAVLLPVTMLRGLTPITMLGTYGLIFGLPWGIAVAATGWLRRDAAITAGVLVGVSALSVLGWSIGHSTEWTSVLPHFVATALVAALATALALRRPTPPAAAD
ncbi:hypothetical protein Cs7R123_52960 [Catellatospora sp. TT07R-123]|uniref:hypothetical protein n=1 Tax=Catellatospora sp. TT07R-123 TaxID=2733863 RepID=UPI001B1FF080|nr:hypothetical protein [Catellatospora sp. TT07R-123]GHJ47954.1 hypothetical protein Cs7R123_52960 [Catellatospora sp. TT07R-123]